MKFPMLCCCAGQPWPLFPLPQKMLGEASKLEDQGSLRDSSNAVIDTDRLGRRAWWVTGKKEMKLDEKLVP